MVDIAYNWSHSSYNVVKLLFFSTLTLNFYIIFGRLLGIIWLNWDFLSSGKELQYLPLSVGRLVGWLVGRLVGLSVCL